MVVLEKSLPGKFLFHMLAYQDWYGVVDAA